MPLYISCVYINFMYFGTAAAWHLRLPALAEACAAGIIAELIYAPYDIVGIKFLWWTWHDTDSAIAARIFGVPIGSSMWVVTFSATFAYFFRSTTSGARFKNEPLSLRDCWVTVAKLSALSTPVMMVQMTVFQMGTGLDIIWANGGLPPSPAPGPRGFVACLLLYGHIVRSALKAAPPRRSALCPRTLRSAPGADLISCCHLCVHFMTPLVIMVVADPSTHVSTSMQQRYGPCGMVHLDITGNEVTEFVCAEEFQEDYSFDCPFEDGSRTRSDLFKAAPRGVDEIVRRTCNPPRAFAQRSSLP